MTAVPSPVPIEVLESTPSTMDEARERVISGRARFTESTIACACVMAREQTAGRGQRGRIWFAARDESLCATYILRCPGVTHPAAAGSLAILAGVAAADVLAHLKVPSAVGLKWPNDILLNGRKAGGILVELMRSPQGIWIALVGVGLNVSVSEFPPHLAASATSLLIEGADPAGLLDLEALARDIGVSLSAWAWRCRTGPKTAIQSWRRFDATTGRRYETEWNGAPATGTARGIDDVGALLLRLADGTSIAVTSATSLREIQG